MAVMAVLAIDTDMAIMTNIHFSWIKPGIKCKELVLR